MNITRKNNSVPVRNKTDVLVVGGGPAGFGAAKHSSSGPTSNVTSAATEKS